MARRRRRGGNFRVGINVVMKGSKEAMEQLRTINEIYKQGANAVSYAIAVDIMKLAKTRTPVLTEALKNSGFVSLPRVSLVVFGFGGPAAEYALIQHENLRYRHRVGRAKFLFSAMVDVANSEAVARAAEILNRAAKDGVISRVKVRRDPSMPISSSGG